MQKANDFCWVPWLLGCALMLFFGHSVSSGSDTAQIQIKASTGIDTLVVGLPGAIVVELSTGATEVSSASFSFKWLFSNGNIVGPVPPPDHPTFSQRAIATFESRGSSFGNGGNPETTLVAVGEFLTEPYWTGTGEIFRFDFIPLDTGSIEINPLYQGGAPSQITQVYSLPFAMSMEITATAPTTTVVECAALIVTGDVNRSTDITSSDIILLINYVFKSGPEPQPLAIAGDVNCAGGVSSADIVTLVNFVFKSGSLPCDVCASLAIQ